MPVEMNPDVESASLSIWEGEKREEVKALPSPEVPAEQAKAALEKKAAETQLQPNIQSLFNYFKIPEMPEASATSLILMSEEKLTQVLEPMLDYAIDGSSYELGEQVPASLANWVPSTTIESTNSRRDRYLREYQGDQKAATEAAIARNHSYLRKGQIFVAGAVPFIGTPTSYSISLWYQLREIALIAEIHGHNIHDPQVKMKILSALIGGDLLKIPAATVDFVARKILKKVLIEAGIKGVAPGIPAHLLFNFFSDNAAKVSTHAKTLFAEGNSIPVPTTEYRSAD